MVLCISEKSDHVSPSMALGGNQLLIHTKSGVWVLRTVKCQRAPLQGVQMNDDSIGIYR